MYHRPFRSILLLSVLVCLAVLPGMLTVRATASSKQVEHSFQPTGHGVVQPQRVSTTTMPQVQAPQSVASQATTTSNLPPVSNSQGQVAPSSNVVRVPPAGSTDPSANEGIAEKSGEGNPDANGTGGNDNYLETVSAQLAIFSRSGTQQLITTYQSWFGVNSTFYDPIVMWDDTGDRFIFSAIQTGEKYIWLSVAQQTNALGNYCNYKFPTLAGHDFDHLGVNATGIYFGFNILAQGSQNKVVNNELFSAGRIALESCQTANYTYWTHLTNPDGTIAEAINPAREDSSTANTEYLVNSIPAGACKLTLWTLTSSGNLSNTSISTQCYTPPPPAKQKGSSALIYTGGDCSVTQVSYVNGLLTLDTPGTHDWGDGNGPVGIVEWYQLNPSTASVAKQGAFGTPGYSLFYPSTITTANGHMLFVYNASGPGIYPSVWYVNQSLTGTTALANGTGYYGTAGISVWGYYQSAWPDTNSLNANAVWITGEYVKSTNTWGTRFSLVTP